MHQVVLIPSTQKKKKKIWLHTFLGKGGREVSRFPFVQTTKLTPCWKLYLDTISRLEPWVITPSLPGSVVTSYNLVIKSHVWLHTLGSRESHTDDLGRVTASLDSASSSVKWVTVPTGTLNGVTEEPWEENLALIFEWVWKYPKALFSGNLVEERTKRWYHSRAASGFQDSHHLQLGKRQSSRRPEVAIFNSFGVGRGLGPSAELLRQPGGSEAGAGLRL